jgi:hypothetical protein
MIRAFLRTDQTPGHCVLDGGKPAAPTRYGPGAASDAGSASGPLARLDEAGDARPSIAVMETERACGDVRRAGLPAHRAKRLAAAKKTPHDWSIKGTKLRHKSHKNRNRLAFAGQLELRLSPHFICAFVCFSSAVPFVDRSSRYRPPGTAPLSYVANGLGWSGNSSPCTASVRIEAVARYTARPTGALRCGAEEA